MATRTVLVMAMVALGVSGMDCLTDVTGEKFCRCVTAVDCEGTGAVVPCAEWKCTGGWCSRETVACPPVQLCPDGSKPVKRPGECCPTVCPMTQTCTTDATCEQPADPCRWNVCLAGKCVEEAMGCVPVICPDGTKAKPKNGVCCATQDDCPKCEGTGCPCMSPADCGMSPDPCLVFTCPSRKCVLGDNCPRVVCSDGSVPPKRPGECCPRQEDCPACTGSWCPCTTAADCGLPKSWCHEFLCVSNRCREYLKEECEV